MKAVKRALCLLLAACTLFAGTGAYADINNSPDHIIINQIYGGGEENDGKDIETPVSHAFVELYNPTDDAVTIDNWSLQYAAEGNGGFIRLRARYSRGRRTLCGAGSITRAQDFR